MKVLVTGASGFIGQSFILHLLKKQYQVIAVSRQTKQEYFAKYSLPVEFIQWKNPETEELKSELLAEVDVVVHLAGESIASSYWTASTKKRLIDSRVQSAKNLLSAVQAHSPKCKQFITASATGIYGDRMDEILTEDSKLGQGFLADLCKEWEAASVPKKAGIQHLSVRIGVVLGQGQGFLAKMEEIYSHYIGGPLASGKQYLSWIHIQDLVRILEYSISKQLSGSINAVAPEPVSNAVFSKAMAKALNVFELFPVPSFALKLLLGEQACIALDSQRVIPQNLLKYGFEFDFKNIESALQEIYHYKKNPNNLAHSAILYLDYPVSEVFDFFASEKNLEIITPEFLNFKVLSKTTPQIQAQTQIDYKLNIHSIPVKWRTLISEWQKDQYFIDEQLKGPYSLWKHRHNFSPLGKGCLVEDFVIYRMPLGFLGRVFARPLVQRDVRNIFDFRTKKMLSIFHKKT